MTKIICVDFDDTIEALDKDGNCIYNQPLINVLIEAQKNDAKIIGFSNWLSSNYSRGSPGRKMIIDELERRGLKLDAMMTTYSHLCIYDQIEKNRKSSQSPREYLNSLNMEERISLLNFMYQNYIQPLEANNEYTMGKEVGNLLFQYMDEIETNLKLNKDSAVSGELQLGHVLPIDAKSNGGKEPMFRGLIAVIGHEHEYFIFDDKSEVSNVARQIAQNENVAMHGFTVMRMKNIVRDGNISRSIELFNYENAINNPQQEIEHLSYIQNIHHDLDILSGNFIEKLDAMIEKIQPAKHQYRIFGKSSAQKESNAKEYLSNVRNAFLALNHKCGTAEMNACEDALKNLNSSFNNHKEIFGRAKISTAEYQAFKNDMKNLIDFQKENNPSYLAILKLKKEVASKKALHLTDIIQQTIDDTKDKIPQKVADVVNQLQYLDLSNLISMDKWNDNQSTQFNLLNQVVYEIELSDYENVDLETATALKNICNMLSSVYGLLQSIPQANEDHRNAFNSKKAKVDGIVKNIEEREFNDQNTYRV